jgi:hypothetical protein
MEYKEYPVLEYSPGDRVEVDGYEGSVIRIMRKLENNDYEIRIVTRHGKVVGRVSTSAKYLKPWVYVRKPRRG